MQVSCRGACFVGALVLTAIAGLFMLLTPALLALYLFGKRGEALFLLAQQMVQGMWLANVAILLEQWHGMSTEIYIIGDKSRLPCITSAERAVWISNHRTRIDWMLLWSLGLRTNTLHQLKIVLKDSLRAVPVFGWAMQAFQFIFLSRDWKNDEKTLTRLLTHLGRTRPNSTYLFFPEGTDLSPSNMIKSNHFAATRGQPPRSYTLYPRTTGWNHMFPLVRDHVDAVYDLTLCFVDYEPNERPSEACLLTGRMPSTIKILLERIPIESIPLDAASLRQWMEERFAAKEAVLHQWHTKQRLPPTAERILDHDILQRAHLVQAFWILLCTLCYMMLYQYIVVRVCGVLAVIAYVVITRNGGTDGFLTSRNVT
ncbi:hypothetical protein H310_02402 [Aphanomyces invadans]|uniref:Phospholipid/glycerol acyltransferase domain-containing protein n=1 Tax=Aphanomyces invadans TaxID=157072 RepID=A0A024UQB9_9STRA|nr:hypothetical protein H310_02402 [Aphanomyces invadans]ETW08027.1 hypothetical protein H310_02402 [Aphanomyces invadans]|eukprot:XP_008864120.1 hypothetical protein H310_02402 [Aphanomyces invadans]